MIVPKYWAEGIARQGEKRKRITVRRFGWSDTSQEEAQASADARAKEALERVVAGEDLKRRDERISYNGADGLPIREEIVDKRGDAVVTRTTYGARCINTPKVLFADIDFREGPSGLLLGIVAVPMFFCAIAAGWHFSSVGVGVVAGMVLLPVWYFVTVQLHRVLQRLAGPQEKAVLARIRKFLARHPAWNLRVYRTPAGLRLLATHAVFEPRDAVVSDCFRELDVDRMYVEMCHKQNCFRARVSAKPWRIGISKHMRPRPGVWPVRPEKMAVRNEWIEKYEATAKGFAACAFMESCGSGNVHPEVKVVMEWHDELCRARSGLPIA